MNFGIVYGISAFSLSQDIGVSVAEAKRRLQMVGAPTEPEDIDISRSYLKEIIYKSQFIRRRYTIMDVAVRLNRYEEWLDRLFSERGLWPIDR